MIPEDRGFLISNGNVMHERDLIYKFAEPIRHLYENAGRNILLITASWGDRENSYDHISESFEKIGIDRNNIHNLLIYGKMRKYLGLNPVIGSRHSKIRRLKRSIQSFYRLKNRRLVAMFRDLFEMFRITFPDTELSKIIIYKNTENISDYNRLISENTFHYLGRDIKATLRQIRFQDNIFSRVDSRLAGLFFEESGIMEDPEFQRIKSDLEGMINHASSIFIFGGNISTLLDSISFFRLNDIFESQLERKAGIFTISAGSMIMCRNVIIYNDFSHLNSPIRSEFEFFSRGLGLIKGVQIFPHCKDRIKMDDRNNLSYLAYRFKDQVCTGLDQNSYLLTFNSDGRQRTLSYGENEGAYIFDIQGNRVTKSFGEYLV